MDDNNQTGAHTEAMEPKDPGQVTAVHSEGDTSRLTAHMETIEESTEETDSRPLTRSKIIPSQQGRRAMLTRTPAPTSRPHSGAVEDRNDAHENGQTVDKDNEIPDVLITELKEDTVIKTHRGEIVHDDEHDSSFCSGEEDNANTNDEDDGWDTDLEIDDETSPRKDISHQTRYTLICEKLGIVPISFFARHLQEKKITMRNHGIGPAGAKAIARTLKDIITIDTINLEGNWAEASGGKFIAKMLEENEYINNVNMACNKLGSLGARYMTKMLNLNTTLKILDLSNNEFHESDASYFAEMMEENKTLKELYLSRNNFSDYSGEILGPAIGANDNLEVLDLSWNRIRLKGALAVAKGLKENVRIKTCNLSWNGFGPAGGNVIAEAITSNSSILELDLTGNRLDTNSALKIAKALLTNDSLQILRIGNNPIATTGAVAIITAISANENSQMELIDLSSIPVEYEFLRAAEELQRSRPLKVIYGPVLRSGNTADDIGKPAIDPFKPRDAVIVLKDHLVVNDDSLYDVLNKYDVGGTLTVTPEDFVSALQDLGVNEDREKLTEIVNKLNRTQDGKIYFGDHNMNASKS